MNSLAASMLPSNPQALRVAQGDKGK